MLSINNIPLPCPTALVIARGKPKDTDYLSLFEVKATWLGLSMDDMKLILKDTQQSFTLGLPNPRTGLMQGVTAKLSQCTAKHRSDTRCDLELLMEEIH